MYRLLEEGESFQEGDAYFNGMGVWHTVPVDWLKMKFSHEQDNTMSRMKLPVRREISQEHGNLDNAAIAETNKSSIRFPEYAVAERDFLFWWRKHSKSQIMCGSLMRKFYDIIVENPRLKTNIVVWGKEIKMLNPKRWGGPVTDHPFNVKDHNPQKENRETEPSTSHNKHMLQFPDTCEGCFFQHKCKNRDGVDFAYCGLECDKIWDNYSRKL